MDFDAIIKSTKNEYANKVSDGVVGGDVTKFIDTGSYSYNALVSGSIYGGIPQNKISGIAGAESTGKTFFAMSMVKTFLDQHPDGVVIYFDTEGAITQEMCADTDIPLDK